METHPEVMRVVEDHHRPNVQLVVLDFKYEDDRYEVVMESVNEDLGTLVLSFVAKNGVIIEPTEEITSLEGNFPRPCDFDGRMTTPYGVVVQSAVDRASAMGFKVDINQEEYSPEVGYKEYNPVNGDKVVKRPVLWNTIKRMIP